MYKNWCALLDNRPVLLRGN